MDKEKENREAAEARRQVLLVAYTFAQESRNHNDLIAWEITAIVWGGQTLLLGFVIDAVYNSAARPLILLVSVLCIILVYSNIKLLGKRREVCDHMRHTSVKIEDLLNDMEVKPQKTLDESYKRGVQFSAFLIVNYSFCIMWVSVFSWTLFLTIREMRA